MRAAPSRCRAVSTGVRRRAACGMRARRCSPRSRIPTALPRSLDSLLEAFGCDGVALHAIGPKGRLEPWCARGHWQAAPGDLRECIGVPLFRGRERVGALDLRGTQGPALEPGTAIAGAHRFRRARRRARRAARTGAPAPRPRPRRGHGTRRRAARSTSGCSRSSRARSAAARRSPSSRSTSTTSRRLNARYGQPAGDQVLAECALVLKVTLRDGDFLARLADDEFGVVLPDCDLAPARRLAERLRHAIEEHRFARAGRVSCSAGVASTPRDGLDATELLSAPNRRSASPRRPDVTAPRPAARRTRTDSSSSTRHRHDGERSQTTLPTGVPPSRPRGPASRRRCLACWSSRTTPRWRTCCARCSSTSPTRWCSPRPPRRPCAADRRGVSRPDPHRHQPAREIGPRRHAPRARHRRRGRGDPDDRLRLGRRPRSTRCARAPTTTSPSRSRTSPTFR